MKSSMNLTGRDAFHCQVQHPQAVLDLADRVDRRNAVRDESRKSSQLRQRVAEVMTGEGRRRLFQKAGRGPNDPALPLRRVVEGDRTAVRATMRVGYGFPHEAAVVCMGRAAPTP